MQINQDIIIKKGKKSGKKLAIFCGTHGNELTGIKAVKETLKEIKIEKGEIFFIFVNPPAIKKQIRQINKNLNRCFIKNNKGQYYEDKRAKKLMKILDKCDALLDLHASPGKQSTPFAICEKNAFKIVGKMNINIISYNWDKIEPGAADSYMNQQHKIGICLECGSIYETSKNIKLTKTYIYQFLQHFQAIKTNIRPNQQKKTLIKAKKVIIKKSSDFKFSKNYKDFEKLTPGKTFARDKNKIYKAKKNECIIFPNPQAELNTEACIIGELK